MSDHPEVPAQTCGICNEPIVVDGNGQTGWGHLTIPAVPHFAVSFNEKCEGTVFLHSSKMENK